MRYKSLILLAHFELAERDNTEKPAPNRFKNWQIAMAIKSANGQPSDLPSLADDTVKLVAYSIVSLKRGSERIMDEGEGSAIVTDNISGETFIGWILAKYLQTPVTDDRENKAKVRGETIDPAELKYLRVHYVVTHRWPRESLEFEERQIDVLQKIRDTIA